MKFDSKNFNKTTLIEDVVLPSEIWIFGGLYILITDNENIFYKFKRADENAYYKFFKTNGLIRPKEFKDFNYKKVIDAVAFVKHIKSGKNKFIIKQYKMAIEKEKNKKFDCYKKSFENKKMTVKEIEIKFKNLPYIKPYYDILNSQKMKKLNFKTIIKGENHDEK